MNMYKYLRHLHMLMCVYTITSETLSRTNLGPPNREIIGFEVLIYFQQQYDITSEERSLYFRVPSNSKSVHTANGIISQILSNI